MKRYSKQQIQEAIQYWKAKLTSLNEGIKAKSFAITVQELYDALAEEIEAGNGAAKVWIRADVNADGYYEAAMIPSPKNSNIVEGDSKRCVINATAIADSELDGASLRKISD